MTNDLQTFLKRHKWSLLLLFVIFAGYMVGKDRALRDNARDATAAAAQTR